MELITAICGGSKTIAASMVRKIRVRLIVHFECSRILLAVKSLRVIHIHVLLMASFRRLRIVLHDVVHVHVLELIIKILSALKIILLSHNALIARFLRTATALF